MARLTTWIALRLRRDDGQAMVEYALIVALISVAAVGLFAAIGTDITGAFQKVVDAFK